MLKITYSSAHMQCTGFPWWRLYFYLPYGTFTLKIVDTVIHWILPRNKSDEDIMSVTLRHVKLIKQPEFQIQWNFDFASFEPKLSLNLHYKFIVFMKGHKISIKISLKLQVFTFAFSVIVRSNFDVLPVETPLI